MGIYVKWGKRLLDIVCAALVLLLFSWLYGLLAVLVYLKLGSPVIFCQERPGKGGRIFKMYKFRSMTDARDENGELLSDDARLTPFGKWLRSTSMDELPELWNILRGDMSIVGPRPLLARDVACMTEEQNRRHLVRPGLTGWAQCNGRNALNWDEKLALDGEYVRRCSFRFDMLIIGKTIRNVLKHENVEFASPELDMDLKDWNERKGKEGL